jgi:maltooligosyltrehalose trehalohydrolase
LDHLGIDYDEEARWIVMRRGSLAIACNLGSDPVDVPVTGDIVLAWGEPTGEAKTTRLGGHSFAVVRASG